jgi:predicted DNA-binding transcriptional regulator AlpA
VVLAEIKALRLDLKLSRRALLSIPEAAEILSLSPKTIRNQLSAGTFPIRPVRAAGGVRFRLADVTSYVDSLGARA